MPLIKRKLPAIVLTALAVGCSDDLGAPPELVYDYSMGVPERTMEGSVELPDDVSKGHPINFTVTSYPAIGGDDRRGSVGLLDQLTTGHQKMSFVIFNLPADPYSLKVWVDMDLDGYDEPNDYYGFYNKYIDDEFLGEFSASLVDPGLSPTDVNIVLGRVELEEQ